MCSTRSRRRWSRSTMRQSVICWAMEVMTSSMKSASCHQRAQRHTLQTSPWSLWHNVLRLARVCLLYRVISHRGNTQIVWNSFDVLGSIRACNFELGFVYRMQCCVHCVGLWGKWVAVLLIASGAWPAASKLATSCIVIRIRMRNDVQCDCVDPEIVETGH